jgi:hypothetical protein
MDDPEVPDKLIPIKNATGKRDVDPLDSNRKLVVSKFRSIGLLSSGLSEGIRFVLQLLQECKFV